MRERLQLGPLETLGPVTGPQRIELLAPPLWRRLPWVAAAVAGTVVLWSAAVALGWAELTAWGLIGRRLPRGLEHAIWAVLVIAIATSLAMAFRGVRVEVGAERLAVLGLWPWTVRREFDFGRLRGARFDLASTSAGERAFRAELAFPDAVVVLDLRQRRVWEALRSRFGRGGAP